jgi:acetyltransferase-like isoleucine patch superfamily enzyme
MTLRLALTLASPLDRVSQRLYMRAVQWFLRLHGVEVTGVPLWISPRTYWDRSGGIALGDRCVISHDVRLLTHDFSLDRISEMRGGRGLEELSRRAPVRVGDYAFIGMNVTVLPGVSIGRGSVVGAGAVVTRDVPDETVVAGNPARVISTTAEYWERRQHLFTSAPRRR